MFGIIVLGIVLFLLVSFIAVMIAEEQMLLFLGKDPDKDSIIEACLDKICRMIKRKLYEIRYGKKDRIELEYDEFTGVWSWGR